VARFAEDRKEHMVVVEKPEGTRPLGRPRCRWEDYTKVRWRDVSWINSTLIGTIGRPMFEVGTATSFAVIFEVILNHLRKLTLSGRILLHGDPLLLLFFCIRGSTTLVDLGLPYEVPGSHKTTH